MRDDSDEIKSLIACGLHYCTAFKREIQCWLIKIIFSAFCNQTMSICSPLLLKIYKWIWSGSLFCFLTAIYIYSLACIVSKQVLIPTDDMCCVYEKFFKATVFLLDTNHLCYRMINFVIFWLMHHSQHKIFIHTTMTKYWEMNPNHTWNTFLVMPTNLQAFLTSFQ